MIRLVGIKLFEFHDNGQVSGNFTLDFQNGSLQFVELAGDTVLSFTGQEKGSLVRLVIKNAGGHSLSFGSSVKWLGSDGLSLVSSFEQSELLFLSDGSDIFVSFQPLGGGGGGGNFEYVSSVTLTSSQSSVSFTNLGGGSNSYLLFWTAKALNGTRLVKMQINDEDYYYTFSLSELQGSSIVGGDYGGTRDSWHIGKSAETWTSGGWCMLHPGKYAVMAEGLSFLRDGSKCLVFSGVNKNQTEVSKITVISDSVSFAADSKFSLFRIKEG